MRVAVIGLGEAGSAIAADLVRLGAAVSAYDPATTAAAPSGVARAATLDEAVTGADIVLSLVPATSALEVAGSASGALAAGALYGDCAA
ncbi:MAG: NAD(P)-dependent oxidoreductase, partial [Actinomycetota bacterium]